MNTAFATLLTIPTAIRGGGFSIVEFDGLPQGLLMLYGE